MILIGLHNTYQRNVITKVTSFVSNMNTFQNYVIDRVTFNVINMITN